MNHLAHTEQESREMPLRISTMPERQTIPALLHSKQDDCPACRAIRLLSNPDITTDQRVNAQTVLFLTLGVAGVAN